MATKHGLRHVDEGPANGGRFAVLRVVSVSALATIAAATAIFAALVAGAAQHDNGPAPRFLHAALGDTKQMHKLPTRTLAHMRSSVTHDGVRLTAPWAELSLTSLDAGSSPWRTYEGGSSRTTPFGSESVTLSGISAEEFLTVSTHQGARTWRWRLDTTLDPHLRDGVVSFTDRSGKAVLLHVGQPAILDAHGRRIDVPAHWGLAGRVLTLALDDSRLSLPYTIDPSISLSGSAFTTVKGSGQNGNFTLTIPAGAQAGDLLVVQAVVRSTTAPTVPAASPAWTVLTSQSDATNGLEQYIYTRVMSAGDVASTTSYTWTVPTGVDAAGGMLALRNVDGSPTNPSQQTATASGTTSPATATITTDSIIGSNNAYVVAFYGGKGNFTFAETNASLTGLWGTAENQMPNGSGQLTGNNVGSGSSGASRANSLVSAGQFAASTNVSPNATLSAANAWMLTALSFRVAVPYNQAAPTTSGTVAVGQTLTAATGTWSNSPTSYAYQWVRCDSAGANCTAIAGATASTYVLTSSDSGSTIRVQVTGVNALGTGQTAQSAQTVLVPSPDGSGTLTTPTSSVTAGSTGNTITFTYTAATGGLSSGKVQLTIPTGWTAPSLTTSNAGYTTASTGTVGVAGQVVTVTGVTLAGGATMTITYGSKASGGPGATAYTTAGAQTWSAAEASTSGGTITALASSPSITINPAAANKLAWSQQPTSTGAGSTISPSPTVTVQDTYGNTVTSSSASITVAIGTNPGGGTLSGTKTVSASSGVATFSTLSIDKIGTGYTLTAAATGLTGATSSTFNITVGAPSKVAFVQQPTTATSTATISPSVTVAIQDALGNTVTSSTASVTLAIGTNPGGGTLSGTTSVSAVNGVATFSTLSIDKAGTGYTLTASSTGLTGATSSTFNINIGAAAKLAFVQQPTSATAGAAISPAITVAVQDAGGNTVTSSSASITTAIGTNPSSGTLSGTKTVSAVSGVATFSTLSIDKAGTGYTLTAAATGLTGATSSSFNINVAAVSAAQSTVSASPTSVAADGSTTSTITVTALDAFGNAVSGQAVSLGGSPGTSTITTVSGTTNGSGVATFTAKTTTAGSYTYTATIGATTVLQTASVTFTPGTPTAAQSTVSASPGSVTANGVATSTITVTLKDVNSNAVSGKTVTLAKSGGSSTITTVSGTTNASGQATFTVKDTVAETTTYTATDTTDTVTVTQTAAVTFTPGAVTAAQSTVTSSPGSVVADGSTTSTITVTLKDANSNAVSGKTVTLAKSGGSSTITTVSGTTNASGQATFTVKDTVAETTTYTATDTTDTVTVTQTAAVTFTPGTPTAAQSTVSASPGSVTADGVTTSTVTVTLRDANSNVVSGKTVSLAKSGGSSTITTVTGTTNGSGQATFTVKDTVAETTTYTATDTTDTVTVTQTASVTFTVGAVSASQSTVSASPASVTADGSTTSTITVTLKDGTGNAVSGKTVTLAKSGGSSTITTVSGTTNGSGQATFTVKDTVAESTTYTATDTTDTITVTQTASVTFTPGTPTAAQSTVSASPGSVTANGVATSTITVTLKDVNSNAVSGKTVTLAKSGGSSTITTVSGTTNASGQATFTVKDTVAETTTYTATDTTDTVTVTQTAAVTFTPGAVTAAQSTVTSSPGSVVADGSTTSTITVTLKDANSNAVSGKTVTLAKSGGSSTITTVSGTTNASGQATFTVKDTVAESTTYTATDTTDSVTVTQTASVTFTVGAVSAAQSTIASAPASVLADGSTTSTITVTAKDAFSNPISGQSVSLSQGAGSSTITTVSGTTNGSGQATFTVKDTVAETVTYSATIGITTIVATSNVVFTPGAATHFSVTAPASATAGSAFTMTMRALDANDNTATGYTGIAHFTSSDGAAVLPANYTFTGGDAGLHTFTTAVTLKTAGSRTVTATDTVTGSITGNASVTVNPATAATFTVTTTAGSPQTAGTAFSTTVTAKDAYGNTATGYTGTAHFTSSDGQAVLPANYTFTGGDAGSHTFTNGVTLKTAGAQTVTATDTVTATITGGASVTVGSSSATSLSVTTTAGSPQTAGVAFSTTVTARDAYGNVSTGYTGTAQFSSSDGAAVLPANYTFTGGDAGSHTFANGVTLKTSGTRTITATDTVTGSITGTSAAITVGPAAAASFTVTTTAGSPQTAGTAFSTTVTAKDAYGNTATGYTGTAHFTSSDGQAVLPADYTFTGGDAGSHTFTNGVTLKTAGSKTVVATDSGITGSTSVTVAPAAAATYTVTAASPQTAGTAFSATVTAKDAYGNVATGYTGTAHFTSSDAQAVLPADYTFTGGDAGSHAFTNGVTLKTAGSKSVVATDGGITGNASVTVNPAAAASFTVTTTAGSPQTAGTAFSATVTAKDAYGNTATGYTGTAHFTSSDGQAVLPADYTFTGGDAGSHAFTSGVTLKTAGSKSVVATDGGITGNASVTVAPAALASFAFSLTSPQANNAAFTGANTLTARDAYGNTVTSFNAFADQVTITANAPLTGTVSGIHGANVLNLAADFVNGVADLTSLGLKYTGNAAAGTFTATAQTGETGTSGAVTVGPGSPSRFVVTGAGTQTAGQSQTLTVTAVDVSGNTATSYAGDHALTFSGASSSPSPATAPTVTDKTGAAVAFGSSTTLTFTNGVSTAGGSTTLYRAESATIAATDGTLTTTGADRLAVTVSAAGISSFDLTAATTTPTAGVADALTITARDPYGNTATSFGGDKSLTFAGAGSSSSPVTAPTVTDKTGTARAFGVATTITFTNGVATAGGSTVLTRAESATVTVTDGTHTNGAGLGLTVSAASASTLAVTVNGGASPTAGAGFPVVVDSLDAFGNPSNVSAGTSVSLSRTAGTGTLGGTTTGTVAAGTNQTTITGVTYSKAESGVQLTATRTAGDALAAGSSPTFTVSSLADRLVITQVNGGSSPTAGSTFSVVVQAQDSVGNPGNVSAATDVALSLNTGTGSLGGTLTGTIAAGSSQVTISGVTYTKAESGVKLAAARTSGDSLIPAVSAPFTVDPGAASKFVVTGSGAQTAGTPNAVTLTAEDANGNVATGYTGDHGITFSGAGSSANPVTAPTATDKSGSAVAFGSSATLTFTSGVSTAGGSTVLTKSETATVVATDGSITASGADRLSVVVTAASVSKLVVTTTAGSPQTAGGSFSVTVTAEDAFGNRSTTYGGTVTLTSNDGQAALPAAYTFVPGDAGQKTFTGVVLKSAGARTVDAGDGSVTGSASVTVSPAAASTYTVTAASPQTAGTAFSTTVTAKDAYGNTATGYTGTAHFTSNDGQAVLPADYTFTGGDAGSHTFTNGVTLKTAGSKTFTATDGAITGNATVTVNPATLASFTLSLASPQTNGSAFTGTNTLAARDAYGNVVTSFDASADHVTLVSNAPLAGTLSGGSLTGAGDFTGGVADLTALGVAYTGTSGSGTFTATAQTGETGTSAAVTVAPGAASKLVLSGAATQTAGQAQQLTITAKDASGNVATSYSGDHAVTFGGAGPIGGFGPTVTDKGSTQVAFGTATTIAFANGVSTSGGSTTLYAAGTSVLTATAGALTTTGADRLSVAVSPAPASTATSTVSASPTSLTADGTSTSTITVRTKDPYGNDRTGGGPTVGVSTDRGSLSSVTDNGDGTFTATLTSSTTTATAHVTATIDGSAVTSSATVAFTPGAANAGHSTVSASPSSVTADGSSTSTVTVRAKDVNDNQLSTGGATVVLATDRGSLSSVTDNGDGTYTATLTSSTSAGTAHVTGTLNGSALTGVDVTFAPGAANAAHTTISAAPATVSADGVTASTVTVRVKDVNDNQVGSGGAAIVLATDRGALSPVTDNGDGTYTATITSTSAGTAHVTGTLGGAAIGQSGVVTFTTGAGSAAHTVIGAAPTSLVASGATTAAVTVRVYDVNDNALAVGGDTVVLVTDRGSLSSVTDNGDGTYGATLTSSTSAGTAHVTGTLNGSAIANSASVAFVAGAANASHSTLTAAPAALTANGSSTATVTVRAKDVNDNALTAGGDTVLVATDRGSLSTVTDNGDGTYTATLTSTTSTGTAHLSGTINGSALSAATVDFVPGVANAAHSTLTAAPGSITANGTSTATVTVRARDVNDNALSAGGDIVALATDRGSLSSVTDNGDGTYTATLTSATSTGTANVTGTLNGSALTATAVTFVPGAADAAHSTLTATPASITADGTSTATVTVRAKDVNDNLLSTGGATVALSTDRGSLSSVTDNGDGTYTAVLTAATTTGTAHLAGTLNGAALAATTVDFVPGAANAAHSTLIAAPGSLTADGTSTATVTVRAKDVNDNTLTAGGDTVALATDLGLLSSVTDNGDGTYTATLTAATTAGTAHLTGTIDGSAVTATTVSLLPGAIDAAHSSVVAASGVASTDTGNTVAVTVTVRDAHDNAIPNVHVVLAQGATSSSISPNPLAGADTDSSGRAVFTVADTVAETAVYSATAGATTITQTASVQFQAGAATKLVFGQQPANTVAGATIAPAVTVRILDAHDNLTSSTAQVGLAVAGAPLAGTTPVTAVGGVATFSDLSVTKAGTGYKLTASSTGPPGVDSTAFDIAIAAASAAHTTLSVSPASINADGTSGTSTITVHVKDAFDNPLSTGGSTVALLTDRGSLSSVSDNGDGTYTAALTATGVPGTAHVGGTLDGATIGDTASVTLVPPVPVVAIDSGVASSPTSSSSATFTFHSTNAGSDPALTFECSIDGGAFSACASPKTYTGLADGSHTFRVHGVNDNGPGPNEASSWTSDTSAPTVSLTTAPGAFTNNASEPLAASASDTTTSVASVEFRYAPNAAACATSVSTIFIDTTAPYGATWTIPADGSYAVCAIATDAVGNQSAPVSSDVVVDRTKPTVGLTAFGTTVGPNTYVHGTPTLHATAGDATAGIGSVDLTVAPGGSLAHLTAAPYDAPWDTTALTDGTHTVTAAATDKASNSDSASRTVIVDNTAPSASLDDPGAFGHGTISLTVTASDTGSGVDTAATVIQSSPQGAGTWSAIASPATWTPADGAYDLRALVSDNVGNQTLTATRTILVDNSAPTVTDDADASWHLADVTVHLNAADAESGVGSVSYKVDGGSWTTGTTVVVAAPSDGSNDGDHTVTYHATNRAGVSSADATAHVKIDHTPPANVTLDHPVAASIIRGTLPGTNLDATASDATSGIASTTFRLAAANTLQANPCNTFGSAFSAPFDTTTLADGHYDVWVAATDQAGNGRCSVVPHDVVVDNTAPVTTDNAPAGAQNHDVTVTLAATDNLTGVASTEYSLDNGSTWTPGTTVSILASSGDGTKTVLYRSTDNAGNVETTRSTQVTIDTTAPAGNPTDPGNVLHGTVQLTASPTDPDTASVEFLYRVVGGSGPYTSIGVDTTAPYELPWITNALADGVYDLQLKVTDSAGNVSTQQLSPKTIDNTAPDSASVTSPGANADLGGTISLAAIAHDATSGVGAVAFEVKATGSSSFVTVDADTSAPYTGSWNSAGTPDGPAQVRVAVTDVAGNGPFYSAPVSFVVDNTAPTVSVSAPSFVSGTVPVSAAGAADIASVQFDVSPHGANTWSSLGTDSTAPFAASWPTGALADGLYDVRATAVDGGSNQGTDLKTVRVDNTSPTGSLTQPAGGDTIGGPSVALDATAADAGSGVASVTFQYRPHGSSGSFTTAVTLSSAPWQSTWDVTALASGDYDIRVVVTDAAGNTTVGPAHVVTVDSTPPSVSTFAVAPVISGPTALQVTTSPDTAKVTYGYVPAGGSSWTTIGSTVTGPSFAWNFAADAVPDGLYDLRAVAVDAFGNATTVQVANVRVDNTAPKLSTSSPDDGSLVASAGSVTATATEDIGSVSSVELDGVPVTFVPTISGATVTFPTGSLSDGNHFLTGDLVDLAGNSFPFRINLTVGSSSQADVTSKNVSTSVPTALASSDNSASVTVPANVWQQPVPRANDWLVLKIDPSPTSTVPTQSLQLASTVVDVRMFWNLAGTEEHHFDAPLQVDLTDRSGGNGMPATAESGAWRAIPQLSAPGVLPAGQQDGYWRDNSVVHILTRHLSVFALLYGMSAAHVDAPIDFTGVVAADGLTLRWAPGIPGDQVAKFTLYVDGAGTTDFGGRQYEAKLGQITADDPRRFSVTETSLGGVESAASPTLRVVPALAGLTVDQAAAALAARGFTAGQSIPTYAPQLPAGTVVGPNEVRLLTEGSSVDLQVATSAVVRSAFAFTPASAPRIRVTSTALIGRALVSATARVDVTLDLAPYKRVQRWHFFHVRPGATVLRLNLKHRLKPGTYRLYWKATSDSNHTVQRRVTPVNVLAKRAHLHTAKPARVVVVMPDRRTTLSAHGAVPAVVEQTTAEQALVFATYHDVSVVVVDVDREGMQLVRTLRAVFPNTTVVAVSSHAATRQAAAKAGAVPVASRAKVGAAVRAALARTAR